MHLRLANFDGPLDLLLHLIKVQEINIFNIPISLVTEQFLIYIKQVPELNFSEAGEYLAMAAQLVEIKSKMLLPNFEPEQDDAAGLEDVSDDDPRKALIAQLLEQEAAQIRAAAAELQAIALVGERHMASGEAKRREEEWEQLPRPLVGTKFELQEAFMRVLKKFGSAKAIPTVTVKAQRVSIHDRMVQLKEKFDIKDLFTFEDLLEDCIDRYELIVTMMAMLELCKAKQLDFKQEYVYGPIEIFKAERFDEPTPGTEGDLEMDGAPPPAAKAAPEASL